MTRWILIPMVVIALALVVATCVPPTPETTVIEVPSVAETEIATEKPVVVEFMTWGEDQFEVYALEKLTELFQAKYPDIEIKCEIVTTVPVEGAGACTIVTVEAGEQ